MFVSVMQYFVKFATCNEKLTKLYMYNYLRTSKCSREFYNEGILIHY